MDLPKYPPTAPVAMPDESPARQTATALLIVESVLLGLSLPVDALLWLGSMWESDDVARQQRLLGAIPLLGFGALAVAVLAACAAMSVWRNRSDALALTVTTAVGVVVLAVGWVVVVRGVMLDAVYAGVWVVMTAPALLAPALLLVVRRGVRRAQPSPPR